MTCVVALGGLALVACDETPAETDAAVVMRDAYVPPPEDTGPTPDTGAPTDAGPTDAGPPMVMRVRLANMATGQASIGLCVWVVNAGGTAVSVIPPAGMPRFHVPFRGISQYNTLSTLPPGFSFSVRSYAASTVATADPRVLTPCAASPTADTDTLLAEVSVPVEDVPVGGYYTLLASGIGGSSGPTAPRMAAITDDQTPPAAGMARIRLAHLISNLGGALPAGVTGINVCHTPEGGSPAVIMNMDNVSYPEVTDFADITPIVDGVLSLHAAVPTMDCAAATMLPVGPIPVPIPGIPPDMEPDATMTPNPGATNPLTDTFGAGGIFTIFATGDVTMGSGMPYAPTVIPWQDDHPFSLTGGM